MIIGVIVSLFPSKSGKEEIYGAARVAYYLSRELARRGHVVHVFAPSAKDAVEEEGNLIVHFYRSFLKIGIARISPKLFLDPLKYDVDVIHIHYDTPVSVVAGLAYWKTKKRPMVVTWHGDWIESYGASLGGSPFGYRISG